MLQSPNEVSEGASRALRYVCARALSRHFSHKMTSIQPPQAVPPSQWARGLRASRGCSDCFAAKFCVSRGTHPIKPSPRWRPSRSLKRILFPAIVLRRQPLLSLSVLFSRETVSPCLISQPQRACANAFSRATSRETRIAMKMW